MPFEIIVAIVFLICLACFYLVNLHNILVVHKRGTHKKIYEKVEKPSGFSVGLAALGTFIYFIEVLGYVFLAFTGQIFGLDNIVFKFPSNFYMQILGLILTLVGYFLFIWSVIVRGRYAVSWEMPENQKLITWGPYRYVRHPSYLGYFLMFFGLFFTWTNIFTFLPLITIPGYLQVTFAEEKLLVQRFGEEYLEYQKRTGQFIPRLRKREKDY